MGFLFGGIITGNSSAVVDTYQFANLSTRGAAAANLSAGRYNFRAAGNNTNAFTFGGWTNTTVSTVENYLFATPTTKGTTPSALSGIRHGTAASSNNTNAFTYGGRTSSDSNAVENYVFATPTSKGTSPSTLSTARAHLRATGNNTVAFVFGGSTGEGSAFVSTVEQYQYASPGTKGTTPSVLAQAKDGMGVGANATIALVMGGRTTSGGTNIATGEQYIFATPTTKGAAPANLASANASAGDLCSGISLLLVYGSYAEHYILATPSSKGASPATCTVEWGGAGATNYTKS
jgi:hypothetical protein